MCKNLDSEVLIFLRASPDKMTSEVYNNKDTYSIYRLSLRCMK